MTTIAFIGLGAMGRPMARRLVEAQHRVVGYDLNPRRSASSKRMEATPARRLRTPRAGPRRWC